MNKRGQAFIIGIIVFLALAGLIAIGKATFFADTGNFNYDLVYKADWGHVGCIAGATETLAGIRYADDVTSTTCSENVGTAGCQIKLTNTGICKTFGISYNVFYSINICNSDGTSCSNYGDTLLVNQQKFLNLPTGKKADFSKSFLNDKSCYTWERTGAVYSLQGEENGKIFTGNQGSCMISDSLKHQVVSESPNPIPFGTYQNYLLDFIQVATKTYSYNGQNVVCQARQIYSITNQQMKDGSTIKIQGNNIGNVDCCPNEANCGEDFKFHTTITRECTFSTECSNGGNPYGATQTTAFQYSCDSGTCVKHTINVECTSDAVCQQRHGEGYVCDLSTQNYGTCKQSVGTFCGDGYCDIGESKSSCPQDCSLECKTGEKIVTTTSNINCKFLFWFCDQKTTQSCDSGWNWWKILTIALIIALLIGVGIWFFNR